MSDGYDFDKEDFDEQRIVFQELAKSITPLFMALVHEGLTGQHAAALTAAIMSQGMPNMQRPKED